VDGHRPIITATPGDCDDRLTAVLVYRESRGGQGDSPGPVFIVENSQHRSGLPAQAGTAGGGRNHQIGRLIPFPVGIRNNGDLESLGGRIAVSPGKGAGNSKIVVVGGPIALGRCTARGVVVVTHPHGTIRAAGSSDTDNLLAKRAILIYRIGSRTEGKGTGTIVVDNGHLGRAGNSHEGPVCGVGKGNIKRLG